jgi:hypothetical protein
MRGSESAAGGAKPGCDVRPGHASPAALSDLSVTPGVTIARSPFPSAAMLAQINCPRIVRIVGKRARSSPTSCDFSKADAQGGLLSQTYATGGSFTYADVSATAVSGSFDLAFGTDHVAGSFVAKVCTN